MSDAKRRALEGLAGAVPQALKVIVEALKQTEVPRNAQHRYSLARYVLDVVLERLPEADDKPASNVAQLTPAAAVSELRKRLSGGG
jgi:hypothetical protein